MHRISGRATRAGTEGQVTASESRAGPGHGSRSVVPAPCTANTRVARLRQLLNARWAVAGPDPGSRRQV